MWFWMATAVSSQPEGMPLTLRVVDADTRRGVPNAEVVRAGVRERHAVSPETGAWTGTVEIFPDGLEAFFRPGELVEYDVLAPGYVPVRVSYTLRRRAHQRVTIPLEPLSWPEPTEAAPAIERRTHAEYRRWLEGSLATEPEVLRERYQARLRLASLSEEWLAWVDETGGDRTLAEHVCRLASSRPERCEP